MRGRGSLEDSGKHDTHTGPLQESCRPLLETIFDSPYTPGPRAVSIKGVGGVPVDTRGSRGSRSRRPEL